MSAFAIGVSLGLLKAAFSKVENHLDAPDAREEVRRIYTELNDLRVQNLSRAARTRSQRVFEEAKAFRACAEKLAADVAAAWELVK